MYYEYAIPGSGSHYVELATSVKRGEKTPLHRARDGQPEIMVARLGRRQAGQPSDQSARKPRNLGGNWQPLTNGYLFHDPGYQVSHKPHASHAASWRQASTSVVSPSPQSRGPASSIS